MHTLYLQTPLSVDVLDNSEGATASYNVLNNTNSKTADIVINGALMEAKLFVYGKV